MTINLTLERPLTNLDIRVVGIGGAGCSALRSLCDSLPDDARFLGIDTGTGTDSVRNFAEFIQVGDGFGSGGDAVAAAELFVDSDGPGEYGKAVTEFVTGADVVIIVAGLGRGSGSGIAPLVAHIAHDSGALTLAAVNLPFEFEGRFRTQSAVQALEILRNAVDTVIVTSNNDLLSPVRAAGSMSLVDAFKEADRKVSNSVSTVVSALAVSADKFGEVRRSLGQSVSGKSIVLLASSHGLHAGKYAVIRAFEGLSSGGIDTSGGCVARSVVVHIEGGIGMSSGQVQETVAVAMARTGGRADMHVTTVRDVALGPQIRVTLILTGIDPSQDLNSSGKLRPYRKINSDAHSVQPAELQSRDAVPVERYAPLPVRRRGPMLLSAG